MAVFSQKAAFFVRNGLFLPPNRWQFDGSGGSFFILLEPTLSRSLAVAAVATKKQKKN